MRVVHKESLPLVSSFCSFCLVIKKRKDRQTNFVIKNTSKQMKIKLNKKLRESCYSDQQVRWNPAFLLVILTTCLVALVQGKSYNEPKNINRYSTGYNHGGDIGDCCYYKPFVPPPPPCVRGKPPVIHPCSVPPKCECVEWSQVPDSFFKK